VIRGLEDSAADYASLMNDIFSYQKEIEFEGELHNCVLVVQNFFSCDSVQAVNMVNELMTSRMRQFERIVSVDLPILYNDFDLDTPTRTTLNEYVVELQDWMAGILYWHQQTRRYLESELHYPGTPETSTLGGPRGLGTSAARLAARLAAQLRANSAVAPRATEFSLAAPVTGAALAGASV